INSNLTFTTDRFEHGNSAIHSSNASDNIYLKIADSALFKVIHQSDFTISAWIKYEGNGTYSVGTVFQLYQLFINNKQYIDFGSLKFNYPDKIDFNKWNHMVWTTEKDSIDEFLNGVKIRKISKSKENSFFRDIDY